MNYRLIYERLIARRRASPPIGQAEKHHVIPRCLGGPDEARNVVALTPREHFVAHQLLVKINPGIPALTFAIILMSGRRVIGKHASRSYAWIRRKYAAEKSAAQKGRPRPASATDAMHAACKGKPKSAEHRKKLADANTGKKASEVIRLKISRSLKGKKMAEEQRLRLIAYQTGRPQPWHRGNKYRLGVKNSDETRAKIRIANTGKKHSEARKINIAKGQAAIPDEAILDIRRRYASGSVSQDALAKEFRIGQSHISRIVRRESYSWV